MRGGCRGQVTTREKDNGPQQGEGQWVTTVRDRYRRGREGARRDRENTVEGKCTKGGDGGLCHDPGMREGGRNIKGTGDGEGISRGTGLEGVGVVERDNANY